MTDKFHYHVISRVDPFSNCEYPCHSRCPVRSSNPKVPFHFGVDGYISSTVANIPPFNTGSQMLLRLPLLLLLHFNYIQLAVIQFQIRLQLYSSVYRITVHLRFGLQVDSYPVCSIIIHSYSQFDDPVHSSRFTVTVLN